jgi:hypothetical protein
MIIELILWKVLGREEIQARYSAQTTAWKMTFRGEGQTWLAP